MEKHGWADRQALAASKIVEYSFDETAAQNRCGKRWHQGKPMIPFICHFGNPGAAVLIPELPNARHDGITTVLGTPPILATGRHMPQKRSRKGFGSREVSWLPGPFA